MTRQHLHTYRAALTAAQEGGGVLVSLVERRGSAPQELGAALLATAQGLAAGTIGGGRLEAWALRTAAAQRETQGATLARVNLQRDIGMTCGGEVVLLFEPLGAGATPWLAQVVAALATGEAVEVSTALPSGEVRVAAASRREGPAALATSDGRIRRTLDPGAGWQVAVFGAGHVAQALTRLLLTLDCRVEVLDTRPEWLAQLPTDALLHAEHHADLAAEVERLDPRTFVVVMTQGHATDLPVLVRALARPFPYVGVLGSRVKAQRLRQELLAAGSAPERVAALHCPIGLPLGRSTPPEIAISVAAELLSARGSPESSRWRPPR